MGASRECRCSGPAGVSVASGGIGRLLGDVADVRGSTRGHLGALGAGRECR